MSKTNPHSIYQNLPKEELVEVYFKQHYAELCKGVNRLLADEALSEDLVQEVFIKVWERKHQIDFNDRFIYYLKKSCHHAALAFLSSKSFKLETEPTNDLSGHQLSDQAIQHRELEALVRLAIGKLPEKTRLTFTLSRYEEMTYKEISSQLNISVKAVEKHMSIALKRLREALKNHLVILGIFLCNW